MKPDPITNRAYEEHCLYWYCHTTLAHLGATRTKLELIMYSPEHGGMAWTVQTNWKDAIFWKTNWTFT